jgi:hypothetical protein
MTDFFRIRDRQTGITYYGTLSIGADGRAHLANTAENPAEFQNAAGHQVWGADLDRATRQRIEWRTCHFLARVSARQSSGRSIQRYENPWLRRLTG